MSDLKATIRVARGEQPADLVIRGGTVVNVLSGELQSTDVAVFAGRVVGLGAYEGRETFDAGGCCVAPGFVDAHIHLESSCLTAREFARAVVPRGTTAVVTDPHEIANVAGLEGIRYMIESSRGLPLDVFFMLPSCVPATELETAGARLEAAELETLLGEPRVLGLAEVMNYPGVLAGEPGVLSKIRMAGDRPIDGHAPELSGRDLCAYVAAGIRSDHEAVTLEEALEKVRLGMYVLIREGSVARNMEALLPAVTPASVGRFALVTDDLYPLDLARDGHMDHLLRRAVALGLDPITAMRMATLNPATFLALRRMGAVAPGYDADLVVLEDLEEFRARAVFKRGRLVAKDGRLLVPLSAARHAPRAEVRIDRDHLGSLEIPAGGRGRVSGRVIDIVPDQLITRQVVLRLKVDRGLVVADPARDLAKLAVVERHRGTGNVGLGIVRGLGLREGALASTVAHDAHNVIVAGANDADMRAAIRELERLGGGLVAVREETVLAAVPLPIAGLLTDAPLSTLTDQTMETLEAARALGTRLANPFMTLSFLALSVIPELKLTDRGLVDVASGQLVELLVEGVPEAVS